MEEVNKRKKPASSKPFGTRQSEEKKRKYQQAQLAKSGQRTSSNGNWYSGDRPTRRETLARVYQLGMEDPSKRDRLMQLYDAEVSNPNSILYNPYTKATSTKYTKTNINNTVAAQEEWARLSDELTYWAGRTDRNYSDDEIIGKINWDNYKTLQKMDAARAQGGALELLDAVGYSEDAMYGVLWAARNPNQSTGNAMYDAAKSALGVGNAYQRDELKAERLNPMSQLYNPYAVGSTVDDLAYKYRTDRFDDAWLVENRDLLLDADTAKDYGKIYDAVQNTNAIQAEAEALKQELARYAETGVQADFDYLLEQSEYKNLAKLQESLKSGQIIDTADVIDFDLPTLKAESEAAYLLKQAQLNAGKDPEALETAVEAEKKKWYERIGERASEWLSDWFKDDPIPESEASKPDTMYDEEPAASLTGGMVWAGTSRPGSLSDFRKQQLMMMSGDLPLPETEKEPAAPAEEPKNEYSVREILAAIDKGNYELAAGMNYEDIMRKLEEDPEMLVTDNAQKAILFSLALVGELETPEAQEAAQEYAAAAETAMGLDTSNEVYRFLDEASGGALSETSDNEGIGTGKTIMMGLATGGDKFNDVLANIAGTLVTGYGYLVEGSNKVMNWLGIKGTIPMAEKLQQAGADVANHYDEKLQAQEQFMRENATTAEYIGYTAGSEAVKMAGMGTVAQGIGAAASSVDKVATALEANKLATATKLLTMSPFVAESASAEFQDSIQKSDDFLTSVLSASIIGFATMATSDVGVLKNIEKMGKGALPEIVDVLASSPGVGVKAAVKRWGKGVLMYMGNLIKTGINEGFQEAFENVLGTSATAGLKGEEFKFDRAYRAELTRDAIMGAIGSFSSSIGVMPNYAESVIVANANAHKSVLTPADVKAQMDAFANDLNNPEVMDAAKTAAAELAVGARTGELVAQGALGEIDTSAVDNAAAKLAEAEPAEQAANEAVARADEKFKANMADVAAANELMSAIDAQANAKKAADDARAELAAAQAEQAVATTEAMNAVREQAKTEVQKRFQEIRQFNYSDVDTETNISAVSEMESVADLNGDEFTFGSKSLTKDVADYFEREYGGMVQNPVLGDVLLTKRGAKDSLGHGMTPQKAVAYAAVPEVVKNGKIIDIQRNWKNKQIDTFAIAAPLRIANGEKAGDYYMAVVVQRSQDNQRFYVHDVILQENKTTGPNAPFEPEGVTAPLPAAEEDTPGDAKDPTLESLLEEVRNVKRGKPSGEIQRTQVPPQTARSGLNNTSGTVVNPIRSTRKLSDVLGIGERIGTRKMNNMPRAVLGYYNNRARYLAVRSNQAGNITVNMHEIGHAISHRLNMTGTQQMVANLPAMFAQNYAANELPGEAFAEFMWRYMTDDSQAEAFAGSGFIYQFEQALRRAGIADAVHAARDEMHAYVNATVNERIGSMVVDRSRKERTPIREWFTKALSGLADSTAALEQIDSDIRNRNDDGLAPDESLRDAALMRNTADRRAWNILTGNLTDSNWNIAGDSLAAVIERSGMEGADFDLLNNYMLALHSIDREAQGLPVFDDSISFDERQNFISDVENNHHNVAMAAEEIHAWWHNFMQLFMVDTGYLTQEALDRFEQMYPHYVPTNRVKKNGVRRNGEGGSTYTVRRATGSTEEIYNPMDTIVQNVNTIVKMVSQNNVGLVFDQLYRQYDGLGIYARNVTEDMRLSRVDTTTLHGEIESILTQAHTDQDAMEEVLDLIGNEQTQWRATGNVNLPNVMQVRLPDGTHRFYEFSDNEIFKAVSGMKEQHANGLLDWLGRMTRSMSALTTGSNPLFSIRNFMRDFQKSVNYGSWATSYADGMAKWIRSAYEVWREGGEYEQYKALGGGGWTRIDANTKKGADEYRGELFHGYNTSNTGRTAKWVGKKVWNAITLSRLNEVVEQASRYAEYRFGQQDKTTEAGRQKAFLNAQEATVDFNRAGNSQIAHDLKMIVPFFNASVQGVYQAGREFLSESERGRLPARFAKTVLNTAIASALASGLMLKFMDDEDKEEFMWLSDDLKSDHIYLPNFLGGDAPLIRIPLAQDPLSRAVHGWVTNMMWNTEGMDEPAIELTAIASNILDGFNPISGTVWDPVLAMSTNKNWYGSNIVPTRMQNWHPSTQYTEETADLFVEAGQRLNVSPLMLEYMAEQYTGFLGQIVIPAISKNEFTGEMQGVSAVIAEARKKMTSDPLLSNNITSEFYDSADMFEQIKAAASNNKAQYWLNRSLSEDEARAAVDEAEAMLKSGGVISDTKKLISDAYNRIDVVNANPDLSDHEKYVQTSEIRREMLENVLDANEAIGAYCEKYVNGENLLTRAIFTGNVSRASTTYEKLPETFKADYDAGEIYMTRSHEVWSATGKDAALPKVNYSFSSDGVDYAVTDDMQGQFEDVYKAAYERSVNTISGWDSLSDDEKLSKLKSAHTKAQNAAKKWYLGQIN